MGLFDGYDDPQQFNSGGGLLSRLLALRQFQGQYQPDADIDQTSAVPQAASPTSRTGRSGLVGNGSFTPISKANSSQATPTYLPGSGGADNQEICRLIPASIPGLCLYQCPNGDIRRPPMDARNFGCPPFILGSHGFGL